MGLGKTYYQTCALLGGLMRTKSIKNALIVCPVVVMRNWEKEARIILEDYCDLKGAFIQVIDSSIRKDRRALFLEDALRW
jgi:SNF2 family DNA or RNA helicase